MILEELGFCDYFLLAFDRLRREGTVPGRVVWQGIYSYRVWCEGGEMPAEPTGQLKSGELPAVGDWVVARPSEGGGPGSILAVLPRKSAFSRNAAGRTVNKQIVAANVDEVFIVTDLDVDLNLRRLERYITLVYNSGASPVVVLNKADLSTDVGAAVERVKGVSPGIPVYALSAEKGTGLEQLGNHLGYGKTLAFLGSSGVGKSTIINRLLGEDWLEVGGVREGDGKGRHTTTHRELILIPAGGMVIDTPGMREIQVWGEEGGLLEAFPEIEGLGTACRFRDCRHESETGCAVLEAIAREQLDGERLNSYRKLRAEFESLQRRRGKRARMVERREGKRFTRMVRELDKFNPKRRK